MSRFSPEMNGLKRKEREDENPTKERDSDEAKHDQSRKKSKLSRASPEPDISVRCQVCFEFEGLELRILAGCCDRIYCTNCLVNIIQLHNGKRELKCPHCRHIHRIHDSTKSMTDQQFIREKSCSYSKTLERNNIAIAQPVVVTPAPERCSDQGCLKRAAYYCDDGCGYLCDTHHTQLHTPVAASAASSSSSPSNDASFAHTTMLIDDKADFLQKKEDRRVAAVVTARKPLIEKLSTSLGENMNAVSSKRELEMAIQARISQLEEELKAKKQLAKFVKRTGRICEEELATLHWKHAAAVAARKKRIAMLEKHRQKIESQGTADSSTLAPDDEFNRMCDMSDIQEEQKAFLRERERQTDRLPLRSTPLAVVSFVNQLNESTLLPLKGSKERTELQRFLPADASLDRAKMLYKMSRDGSRAQDFYSECCDKGRLMVLVKANESGNVFGAFINTPLPKPPADGSELTVPDPTAESFVFSLTNQYSVCFKSSLIDDLKDLAFSLSRDGNFRIGAEALLDEDSMYGSYSTVMLFAEGQPAGFNGANIAHHHEPEDEDDEDSMVYELDESSFHANNLKPIGFQFDKQVLAGSNTFAAAEIEVFRI